VGHDDGMCLTLFVKGRPLRLAFAEEHVVRHHLAAEHQQTETVSGHKQAFAVVRYDY